MCRALNPMTPAKSAPGGRGASLVVGGIDAVVHLTGNMSRMYVLCFFFYVGFELNSRSISVCLNK